MARTAIEAEEEYKNAFNRGVSFRGVTHYDSDSPPASPCRHAPKPAPKGPLRVPSLVLDKPAILPAAYLDMPSASNNGACGASFTKYGGGGGCGVMAVTPAC